MYLYYVGDHEVSIEQIRYRGHADPRGLLKRNVLYEVLRRDVHDWYTDIVLAMFPDKCFNSVHFIECEERPPATPTVDPMEPARTLNGKRLTIGQAMTLRMALESFASSLQMTGLGTDDLGISMTKAYLARINELQDIIHSKG